MCAGNHIRLALVLALFGIVISGYAQPPASAETAHPVDSTGRTVTHLPTPLDTMDTGTTGINTPPDSISDKQRTGLGRFIREVIFIDDADRRDDGGVVDEAKILRRFDGKTIGTIFFDRHDVFEDKSNWFRKLANGMHVRTEETAIRRDLLFTEGDTFDAEIAVTSNHILQSRSYISDSWLRVRVNPDDTTRVDIMVTTLDSWSIGVDGELLRDRKRVTGYLYDANFMGGGSRVGMKTHVQYSDWGYGGQIFDYENPNFLGTYYTAMIAGGRNFESSRIEAKVSKEFILRTDYELGASYSNIKDARHRLIYADTLIRDKVRSKLFDLWGGQSWALPGSRSSVYATGHYGHGRFSIRPEDTDATTNAAFHGYDEVLIGTGLYWERFYTSTMIYGYGFQEYIASGHKLEFVGGYSWREFGNYWYAGINIHKGGFTPLGFLTGQLSLGSYIGAHDGKLWQSVLNIEGRWFSSLWGKKRTNVRQFVTLRWMQGWNMGQGAGALMRFNDDTEPVSFDAYASGRNRLLLNTETVVFTPFQPFGFRLAIFGFLDGGFIGNDYNPFKNDFYSTFGVGIRFRNERLIFSAIQLRLGFAVGKNGLVKNKMFSGSVEQRIHQHRFIPGRPDRILYE